jgi:hypothetical protein
LIFLAITACIAARVGITSLINQWRGSISFASNSMAFSGLSFQGNLLIKGVGGYIIANHANKRKNSREEMKIETYNLEGKVFTIN